MSKPQQDRKRAARVQADEVTTQGNSTTIRPTPRHDVETGTRNKVPGYKPTGLPPRVIARQDVALQRRVLPPWKAAAHRALGGKVPVGVTRAPVTTLPVARSRFHAARCDGKEGLEILIFGPIARNYFHTGASATALPYSPLARSRLHAAAKQGRDCTYRCTEPPSRRC